MAIFRSKNQSEYFILSNQTAQDGNLHAESLGVLTYMLSKPADWVFYQSEIAKHFKNDSKYKVDKAIKDLKKHGYLIVKQKRGKNGKFGAKDWTVLDKSTFPPSSDIPSTVTPSTVSPLTDNRQLQNTDSTKDRDLQSNEFNLSQRSVDSSKKRERKKKNKLDQAYKKWCKQVGDEVANFGMQYTKDHVTDTNRYLSYFLKLMEDWSTNQLYTVDLIKQHIAGGKQQPKKQRAIPQWMQDYDDEDIPQPSPEDRAKVAEMLKQYDNEEQ